MTTHEQLSLFPPLDLDKYPQLHKAFTSNQIFFIRKLLNDHTQHIMQLVLSELRGTKCDRLSAIPLAEESVDVFIVDEAITADSQQSVNPKTIRKFIDNNPSILVQYLGNTEFAVYTLAHLLQIYLPLSEHDKLPVEEGGTRTHFAARVNRVALSNAHVWPDNPFIKKRHGVYALKPEYIRLAETASESL